MLTMFARCNANTSSNHSLRYSNLPRSNPSAGRRDRDVVAEALAASEQAFIVQKINEWMADTAHASSISVITRHAAFSELAERRDASIRAILGKMQNGTVHYHWFPLLKKCAGVDPVPAADRGYTMKMAEHWLRWGKEGGKI